MPEKRILVLGVGNILLRDEGVGVRVVERLQADYSFSPNVSLLDGGTLGIKLMEAISSSDVLIVVDAVLNGHPPGTFYRLTGEEVRKSVAFKYSLHQTDLLEPWPAANWWATDPKRWCWASNPRIIPPGPMN